MRTHLLHHYTKENKLFDKIVLIVAVIAPLTSIDQIYTIIAQGTAAGVSIFAWGTQAVFAFILFLYGFSKKDTKLMVLYALWTIIDVAVVLAALAFP